MNHDRRAGGILPQKTFGRFANRTGDAQAPDTSGIAIDFNSIRWWPIRGIAQLHAALVAAEIAYGKDRISLR